MEIARVYLDDGKIKILLSGKHTRSLLIKLTEEIENVYRDLLSAKSGPGTEGPKFSVQLDTIINVATKERSEKLKNSLGSGEARQPATPQAPLSGSGEDRQTRFFKATKKEEK